ncbi:MAG: serine hydrolase [Cyanobacteria bacterium P01_C01_bin.69]
MNNKLSIFTCISFSTLLASLSTPVIKLPVQAQTRLQNSASIAASPLQADDEAIDVFVEELMEDSQIPGLSLAVIHDQKLIKTAGYGMLDREQNVKTRPSSIFPIASISKPITATAVMLLVEEGKLDLDIPISTYLPEAPEGWNTMTLRHVLNHTAGLPEGVGEDDTQTLDGVVATAAEAPLNFQPGEAWMYSNTGYSLAAAIVEKASAQPFSEFVESRIFEPLEMNNTDVLRDSYRFGNRAMGYELIGSDIRPIDVNFNLVHRIMPMFQGSGSVTSNVVDLSRWAIALQKGQLLSAESQAEMEQFGVMNSGLAAQYGLGWILADSNGHRNVTHGGNLWGYSTSLSRFPDDQLTIIVLTNKDSEDGDGIALKIAQQYLPSLIVDADAPAIEDENPALTVQILDYLQGNTAAITSTPERQLALDRTLRGAHINRVWANYRRNHSVESLELISQAVHPNGTRYRYRVIEADDTRLLTAVVTPDGLVAEIGISLED